MGSCLGHPYSLGLFSLREMWVRKVGHNGDPPDGVFHGSPQMWNMFRVFLPWCVGCSCWLQSGLVYLIWAVVFGSDWCIAHPCLVWENPPWWWCEFKGPYMFHYMF